MTRLFRLVDDRIFVISCLSIVLFPVFLYLPIGLGFRRNIFVRGPVLLPILTILLVQAACLVMRKVSFPSARKEFAIVGCFFLLWVVASIRTLRSTTGFELLFVVLDLTAITMVIILVLHTVWLAPEGRVHLVRWAILLALGLHIQLNLVLHIMKVRPDDQIYFASYPSQMLGLFGLSVNRVLFPMADGINQHGLLAGAVLVGLFFLAWEKQCLAGRLFLILLILLCLITIFLTDSRGALLYSTLTIVLASFLRNHPRSLFWGAVTASIMPLALAQVIPSLHLQFLDSLDRSASSWTSVVQQPGVSDSSCELLLAESSGVLSNRSVIWSVVLNQLKFPGLIHLVGYGYRGHVLSGLSGGYSCLFKSYALSELASTHNIWLQLLVDLGYIGMICVAGFLQMLIFKFSDAFAATWDFTFRSMQAVIVYILLIGSLEASLSPDFDLLFILVCIMPFVVLFQKNINRTDALAG